MIRVAEALELIRKNCAPAPAETISLGEGLNRVAAAAIRADVDWPPFDASAMDGYAVRLRDLPREGEVLTERPGLVAAGDPPGVPLSPREAVRVMTGAPVPEGTEAVVPVERVRREEGHVAILSVPRADEHIRRRGESVTAGSLLLPPGRRLTATDIALAALAGAERIAVHGRPRVAVAVTGNELVAVSSKPGVGQLRDSNGPMLSALCRSGGWPVAARAPVPDEAGAVRRLFETAGQGEDVLITSGGVSAGDLDLLPEAAERAGFRILFHGVAVRPGKPIAFGRRDEVFWFGLPGNPVSASVGFRLFVRPALEAMEGVAQPGPAFVSARLTRGISLRGHRETYRDGLLETSGAEARVAPLDSLGSHDLATHARANALIRVPAEAELLPEGALVECLVL
jgi:molybdopterin molybdotransferase